MLFGVRVQSVLLLLRLTIPLKPSRDPIVSVDVPVEPARTVTLVGAAEMLKSCTTKLTVRLCESEALVPVTEMWIVPVVVIVHESVELPEAVMVGGDREQDEVLFVDRLTTPENPFRAETVMVVAPAEPALTVTVEGAAVNAKSRTMIVIVREWESDALVPVMLT